MCFPSGQQDVLGCILLLHPPHALYVLRCITPVPLGRHVSQVYGFQQPVGNPARRPGDLPRDKGLPPPLRLMIEQNSIARVELPLCPFWPPRRRFFLSRLTWFLLMLFRGGSDGGGLEELDEFMLSFARNFFSSASRAAFCFSDSFSATLSSAISLSLGSWEATPMLDHGASVSFRQACVDTAATPGPAAQNRVPRRHSGPERRFPPA